MPKVYQARAGDCVTSIAFEHGFFPDTIWNHPDNADIKALRGDPNVLLAGDAIIIPDLRTRCEVAATGARYRFRRRGVPHTLRLRILRFGKPRANLAYAIAIDGGPPHEGRTDADGWLSHPITPNARVAVVCLDGKDEYRLDLGTLDPIDTLSGVQGRLRILGLYDGPLGAETPQSATAVQAFQRQQGLDATGEIDDPTRARLRVVAGR
jgi:N-acetylmuramoyl-L-alanine amidase